MNLIARVARHSSRRNLVIGGAVCLVLLVLAAAVFGKTGLLLVGLPIGALVALVALSDPLIAIILLMLASFGRLAQKEIVSTELLTPAFLVLIGSLALAVSRGTKRSPRFGGVEWLMACYLALNLLSWALPHQYDAIDPMTGDSQDVYRWILTGTILPFATYVMAKSVFDDDRSVRWMLWATVGMGAYSSWVSILQFRLPALVWPRYIVDSPNWVGRANGVFNQPVVNGVILDIAFLVCLYLASVPGTRHWVRALLYALAAVNAYSVYLTHTRAALLALVIALGLGILFASGWRRGFVAFAALGAAAVVANASRIFSSDRATGGVGSSYELYDRLNIMATAFRAIGEHPFLGIGIGRFLVYNTYEHQAWSQNVGWDRGYNLISHETELGIAAELGIPAALFWIAVLVSILYLLWRAMRELPHDTWLGSPLALVGAIAMITMVVNGLTVDLRLLEFATMLPFLFAGIVVGRLERYRADRPAPRPGVPWGGLRGGTAPEDQQAWHDREAGVAPPDGARLVSPR
ncbi:MAG: hypothetical protein QOE59_5043 [Actinomycetota bacterium]|jgi:O-antigen ligase|nr:hypothetical protein [Actinomycetota bacterium]